MTEFDIPGATREPKENGSTEYTFRGRTIVIEPPPYPDITAPIEAVRGALMSVGRLSRDLETASLDPTLSPLGRRNQTEVATHAAWASVASAKSAIAAIETAAAQEAARLLAAPALDRADALSASVDREIRDWVRGLPREQAVDVLDRMKADHNILHAVLRSPLPLGRVSEMAAQIQREYVAATRPEFERLDAKRKAARWGHDHIGWIERHLKDIDEEATEAMTAPRPRPATARS